MVKQMSGDFWFAASNFLLEVQIWELNHKCPPLSNGMDKEINFRVGQNLNYKVISDWWWSQFGWFLFDKQEKEKAEVPSLTH